MAIEVSKTLAQVNASLSSEPVHSQVITRVPCGDWTGSESEPRGSAVGVAENGVRVSAGGDEGLKGDVCVVGDVKITVKTRVVETEISVGKNFGGPKRNVMGDNGGFLGDAVATEGLSLGHERQGKAEDEAENRTRKVLVKSDSSVLIEDDSDKKVELEQKGISSLVDVHGSSESVKASGDTCGRGDDKGSVAENGGARNKRSTEVEGSDHKMGENGDVTGEGRAKHEDDCNEKKNEEDGDEDEGEDGDEDEGEDGDEDDSDQEHKYVVGDFVWGKIRSHPWWPGRIYDPSDASDYARKHSQRNWLLVAYFGDGSFSWCSPSQLKPFAEDFEEMSSQSNSKSFVNAVDKALDEVGMVVELNLMCSCVREEDRVGLARPSAMNAGIKQGVLVPECDLSRLTIPQQGPADLIGTLRNIAELGSITSLLEFTVLKSWLSAFYRAKGVHGLAMYHEPRHIEGLEEKNRDIETDLVDFSNPVEVPFHGPSEEDWLTSPNQSLLQKCLISEGKLYHRRKNKSVAEILKEDTVVEPKSTKGSVVKDVTSSGRMGSTFGKRKRKSSEDALSQGDRDLASPSGGKRERKKAQIFQSLNSTENKVSSAKNGGMEDEEETKTGEVSIVKDDDGDPKDGTDYMSSPRERKKSKYLSPPFTSLKMVRNLSAKRGLELEYVETAKAAQVGDQMTEADGQLYGSPPVEKRNYETFQNKLSEEADTVADKSANLRPRPPKEYQKIIESGEINRSTKEVMHKVRSAALNPLYSKKKNFIDRVGGFICAFRSAIYLNGSNYKTYHKHRPGKKRKSLNSTPELLEKDLNQTSHELLENDLNQTGHELPESKTPRKRNDKDGSKTPQKRNEKDGQAMSGKPKLKQGSSTASNTNINVKDKGREASPPASILVSFPPGVSLPSKNDIITIFNKFGPLNEKETDVLYNCYCARIVFLKRSDAEEAFNASMKKNHFAPANVNYQLRYDTAASKRRKRNPKEEGKAVPGNLHASQAYAVDEASRLLFIKEKLEVMTSMLEKSDVTTLPELKSNLEGEMKGLLEKVSTMAKSSST